MKTFNPLGWGCSLVEDCAKHEHSLGVNLHHQLTKQHKRAFSGLHFPTTLPVPNTRRWNRRPFDTSDVMAEIREEPHDPSNQVINRYYLYLLFFSPAPLYTRILPKNNVWKIHVSQTN